MSHLPFNLAVNAVCGLQFVRYRTKHECQNEIRVFELTIDPASFPLMMWGRNKRNNKQNCLFLHNEEMEV